MSCECQLKGLCDARKTIRCEKHGGIIKGSREQQICNGTSGLPDEKVAAWFAKWEHRDADEILAERRPPTIPRGGNSRPPGPPPTFDCTHRSLTPLTGEPLAAICKAAGITQDNEGHPLCDLCGGGKGKPFDVWGCDLHGHCTISRKHSRVGKSCVACKDCTGTTVWMQGRAIQTAELTSDEKRQRNLAMLQAEKVNQYYSSRQITATPFDGEPVRHILYHFHPITVSQAQWMRHIEWLREVRGNFNGRFIVGVTTKGDHNDEWDYVHPDEIANMLGGDVEIVTGKNSRILGEGVTFLQMLEKIRTNDPQHVFYYGHTKGVMRDPSLGASPHWWAEVMFNVMFRRPELSVSALERSAICGAFRMPGGYPVGSPGVGPYWFFSGTMFAARCADVFSRNWNHVPLHYGCVEQWPRTLFRITESECLFFDNVNNLYDQGYWESQVWPAYHQWQESQRASVSV